ncbi:hypothetical protein J437_LFUL004470 [Ladona fulva]|uniref:Uncharacterized protein n=1 Tax=Ladona fulva TaxID=123851 RepID=A0A8K0NZD6_LADFU|nr:hypothetical protein J437_LFUL004470 [Ladona fulva]
MLWPLFLCMDVRSAYNSIIHQARISEKDVTGHLPDVTDEETGDDVEDIFKNTDVNDSESDEDKIADDDDLVMNILGDPYMWTLKEEVTKIAEDDDLVTNIPGHPYMWTFTEVQQFLDTNPNLKLQSRACEWVETNSSEIRTLLESVATPFFSKVFWRRDSTSSSFYTLQTIQPTIQRDQGRNFSRYSQS